MIDTRTLSREQKESYAQHVKSAAAAMLKYGDRIRVTKCPGTKRWITFARFDGYWIVSKSGIDDYSPSCVDRVNDQAVDFSAGWTP